MQAELDQDVHEWLEHFLSWLLDARWFPKTDEDEKKRLKADLRSVRRILKRMEAFAKRIPDTRLRQGIDLWKNYESTLSALVKQPLRTAPHISIGGNKKGTPEIAERLMCAVLILPKLRPKVGVYEEIQRLLVDPSLLPRRITTSEEAIQALLAGTLDRPPTGYELHCAQLGRNIAMRPYWASVKALQSSVARLEKELKKFAPNKASAQRVILHRLYGEYLWSQKGQGGFSNEEEAMLNALASPEVVAGSEHSGNKKS